MTRQIVCALLLTAGTAVAQERAPSYDVRVEIDKAQLEGKLRAAIEMKTTVGAPYSAEATTEFVQVLADGNRIVRRTIVRIYRDSEGRVRRENVTADGSRVESVTIVDPVAGSHVVLDPATRTAFGSPSKLRVAEGSTASMREMHHEKAAVEAKMRQRTPMPTQSLPRQPSPERARLHEQTNRQDLGQRSIEGLAAQGTRTTTVLPPGTIGNEQPIRIVTEEWFSPDLQLLVQTKHSDPRSGDTTYTLSNVVRAEPDGSLFDVPADYAVKPSRTRE